MDRLTYEQLHGFGRLKEMNDAQSRAASAATRASLEGTLTWMLTDARRQTPDIFASVPDFDNTVAASLLASWILGQ
jgi:hypothetical protein